MAWTIDNKEQAINPYNFVTLTKTIEREKAVKGPLSGVISCRLITKTPLAIPDTGEMTLERTNDSERKEEHKSFPFFSIGEKKIIPGSELRGMIRAAFEAVTCSCMGVINSNTLSARHPTPRKPGLIRWNIDAGKWELYDAVKKDSDAGGAVKHNWYCINGRVRGSSRCNRKRNGRFECRNRQNKRCSGKARYYLKEEEAILLSKNVAEELNKAVEEFNNDEGIMAIYLKNDKDKYEKDKYENVAYRIKDDGKWYVVFYEEVKNGAIYLSPAQISRSVFRKRLEDLIGDLKTCGHASLENKGLCPACRLFGMISKSCCIGGSVRFGDAELAEVGKDGLKYATLKELAEPKPSSVEFYTQKPEGAKFWNYDYKVTKYDKANDPERFLCDVELNGRKFYLHHKTPAYKSSEKTKRNSTMELIPEDSEFKFDIWFDQLDKGQLNELLWILTFGENSLNGIKWHKIGHGKPIGLGSIKIAVDSIKTRTVTVSNGLVLRDEDKEEFPEVNPFTSQGYVDLEHIAKTRYDRVGYPLGDGGASARNNRYASHQWFIGNRMIRAKNSMQPVISRTLPLVRDGSEAAKLSLPKHKRV